MTELRRRGVVSAVVCSTAFETLGRTQARVFGAADLPLVMIPHPLGGLSRDEVRSRADVAVPQIVDLIRKQLK